MSVFEMLADTIKAAGQVLNEFRCRLNAADSNRSPKRHPLVAKSPADSVLLCLSNQGKRSRCLICDFSVQCILWFFSFGILHSVLNSAVEAVKSVESLIWMSASEVGDEGPFKVCLEQLGAAGQPC